MKVSMKSLLRQKGFTLVELMVVVAIIGLLSAVAIPSFKKYQAKAKVSEAKLQLSAAYTAETAFYSDYNMYAHCLSNMGFDPGQDAPSRYFAVGFRTLVAYDATAYGAATNSGLSATDCPNNTNVVVGSVVTTTPSAVNASWFPAGKGVGSAVVNQAAGVGYLPAAATHGTQATALTQTFVIGAAGIISPDYITNANSAALTINERKLLQTVRNGF